MTTTLDRLLSGLPAYFDREPAREPGLTLSYDGVGISASVLDGALALYLSGGSAGDRTLVVPLAGRTLTQVATLLLGTPGVSAAVVGDGSMSALSLIETDHQDCFAAPRLDRFTSLLWDLLMTSGTALSWTRRNADEGLRQMTLRTAEGQWVDHWGEEYYGGVYRKPGESDAEYAARIIREVLRIRLNNRAIEKILWEELGIHAEIVNLHDYAWVIAVTKIQYLAGVKYSRTTFEVIVWLDGSVSIDEIREIVERNKAAGTLPFYKFVEVGGGAAGYSGQYWEVRERITYIVGIAPNLVWTVGVDPLSQVHLALSLPANLKSIITATALIDLEAPYSITGEGVTIPFALGEGVVPGSALDGPHIVYP